MIIRIFYDKSAPQKGAIVEVPVEITSEFERLITEKGASSMMLTGYISATSSKDKSQQVITFNVEPNPYVKDAAPFLSTLTTLLGSKYNPDLAGISAANFDNIHERIVQHRLKSADCERKLQLLNVERIIQRQEALKARGAEFKRECARIQSQLLGITEQVESSSNSSPVSSASSTLSSSMQALPSLPDAKICSNLQKEIWDICEGMANAMLKCLTSQSLIPFNPLLFTQATDSFLPYENFIKFYDANMGPKNVAQNGSFFQPLVNTFFSKPQLSGWQISLYQQRYVIAKVQEALCNVSSTKINIDDLVKKLNEAFPYHQSSAANVLIEKLLALKEAGREVRLPQQQQEEVKCAASPRGHTAAVKTDCDLALVSELGLDKKIELLAAKRADGTPGLFMAMQKGHAAGFDKKTELLTAKHADGTPGLYMALRNGL